MHTDMEWWTRVRVRMAQEDISKRQLCREEGIGWGTLEKVLSLIAAPLVFLRRAEADADRKP